MSPTTMTATQQSATWELAPGEARRLPAVRRTRWLKVLDGRVWLTLDGALDAFADDCWLLPGALALLPAGREVVLEGYPRASFQLLEPSAVDGIGVAVSTPPRAPPWRDWLQRWSLQPDPPSVEPCPCT